MKNSSNFLHFKSINKLPSFVQAQNIKHYQKTASLQKKWKSRVEEKSGQSTFKQAQSQNQLKIDDSQEKHKKLDNILRSTLVGKLVKELDSLDQLKLSRNHYNKGARGLYLPEINVGRRTVSPHLGVLPHIVHRQALSTTKLSPLSKFAVNSRKFMNSRNEN